MKKLTISLFLLSFFLFSYAQSPQAFKYQAVAREHGGLMDNQTISVRIAILKDSTDMVYAESHEVKTNAYGLFSLNVGKGDNSVGDLKSINWTGASFYIQPEINGNKFPASPILLVTGALKAEKVETVDGAKGGKITGPLHIDLSNDSGGGGRQLMNFSISEDNNLGTFVINRGAFRLYSNDPNDDGSGEGDSADLWLRNLRSSNSIEAKTIGVSGPITIDLSNDSGTGGRQLMSFNISEDNNLGTFVINRGAFRLYSNDPNNNGSGEGDSADLWLRRLNASGDIKAPSLNVSGTTATGILQINGGGDLAEGFDVNATLDKVTPKPGLLVSIDPENPGQLIMATEAYDKKLAGVISGANGIQSGMVMGQKGTIVDGQYPVALSGRVYTWVDASYGTIEPGDMLTSSPTPGHAMKATKIKKSQGAVIGKAMSYLEKGKKGYVLVLIQPY